MEVGRSPSFLSKNAIQPGGRRGFRNGRRFKILRNCYTSTVGEALKGLENMKMKVIVVKPMKRETACPCDSGTIST
jgi:hypothetical protein